MEVERAYKHSRGMIAEGASVVLSMRLPFFFQLCLQRLRHHAGGAQPLYQR